MAPLLTKCRFECLEKTRLAVNGFSY